MQNKQQIDKYLNLSKLFFLSVITALFSLLLVFLISGITVLYFSYDFNIRAILTFSGAVFQTPASSPVWTKDAIITIYLANPILSFFLGLVFMLLFVSVKKKSQSLMFLLFWGMIFSFSNAFGIFVEEGIAKSGTYRVSEIMQFGDVILVISVILAVYFLYVIGLMTGKLLILSIGENWKQHQKPKLNYYLVSFVIPWIMSLAFFAYIGRYKIIVSQLIIYALGCILLLPVLWTQAPRKESLNLEVVSSLNFLDAVAAVLMFFGSWLIYSFLHRGITLPLVF